MAHNVSWDNIVTVFVSCVVLPTHSHLYITGLNDLSVRKLGVV